MQGFSGFVELGDTIPLWFVTRDADQVPTDPAALPTYRVYDATGLLASGTSAKKDTGTITGATNASPIVVTSSGHGLTTGTRVTVSGVGGNTGANGTFTVTALTSSTFSLDGSTGNSAYTSGGSWHVTGLHGFDLSVTALAGFEKGKTYTVLVGASVGGGDWAELITFTVV